MNAHARTSTVGFLAGACLAMVAGVAKAEPEEAKTLSIEAVYTADIVGPVRGGAEKAGRYLDNLDVILDLDLERAAGWRGATLHAYGLSNAGGQPNELVGTLEGVDNIEVGRPRVRLYELWLEQKLAGERVSVLAGLYDLNSEFYATASSDLLIGPAFGIGSELAATGSNGPSIFPSSALAVRVSARLPGDGYVQAALLNADARTLGDPGGIDTDFDDGLLAIAEAGFGRRTRSALGAWRYTEQAPRVAGPERATAQGAYVLLEHQVRADGPLTLFLRAGASDGRTGAFRGSWQAGFLLAPAWPGRPDSAFSAGAHQGLISRGHRANARDEGLDIGATESGLEIAYSDRPMRRVAVQPNLQYVIRPGGVRDARDAIVAGLRITVDLAP
jgi:porin